MADDVQITAGIGTTIATDEISGKHHQKMKIEFGDADTATMVSASNPLPVVQTGALPAGANNIGDVDVASLPSLPAGTNAIGKLASNDGVDIGDVTINNASGASAVNIQDGGNSITVDGTVTANAGTGPWPVTDNGGALSIDDGGGSITVDGTITATVSTGATGDMDSGAGVQNIPLIGVALPGNGGAVTGGTSSAPLRVDPTGTTTQPVSGTVTVTQSTAGNLNCTEASASAIKTAVELLDDTVAIDGSAAPTKGIMLAGTDGTNAQTVKVDTAGELQVDVLTLPSLPAGTNNIGDVDVLTLPALPAGSNNIGDVDVLTAPGTFAEDEAHTTGALGYHVLGVRRDADTSPVSADGDYHHPVFDATGNLKTTLKTALPAGSNAIGKLAPNDAVDIGDVTINNASGASAVNIQDGGNVISVDDGGSTLSIDDGAGSITVDGTVTANAGTGPWPVTDNGGSLTVDNGGTFAVQDSEKITDNAGFTDGTSKVMMAGFAFDETAGTALTENDAAAARIDSKRAQVLVLEDEGTRGRRATVTAANALKVDNSGVTQPVSGTVTVTQATAGNLNCTEASASAIKTAVELIDDTVATDGSAAPTKGIMLAGTDGTNAQTVKVDTAGELQVDVLTLPNVTIGTALPAGTNAIGKLAANSGVDIGDVDVLTMPAVFDEDAAHSSGAKGVHVLGVRRDTDTSPVSADGDYHHPVFDANGNLKTTLKGALPEGFNFIGIVSSYSNTTPTTSGGLLIFRDIDLDEASPANIKAQAGQVYGWSIFNKSASPVYVKLYDKDTAPDLSTDTPVITLSIPANTHIDREFVNGIAFANGIGWAATTGVADNDTGAPGVNDVVANLFYA